MTEGLDLHLGVDKAAGFVGRGQAAVLTPAHQYPRGTVLAAGNRSAFVDWARREDGFIVEDDYDGEFRYDQQPVGAMQALAPDRVVFAGSTSKTLAPGMRLGWLVVPAALRRPLLEVVAELGAAVPAVEQLAMADLISRGSYDRHIRRMRLVYRRRRAELSRLVTTPLEGVAAGLHALLPLESAEQERAVIARGRRAGVDLHGLHVNGYWREPAAPSFRACIWLHARRRDDLRARGRAAAGHPGRETFWEPGGDVIHYQAANNLADRWSRFVVVMMCAPGQEMLVYVDDEELEQRRDRRAPRPPR